MKIIFPELEFQEDYMADKSAKTRKPTITFQPDEDIAAAFEVTQRGCKSVAYETGGQCCQITACT
jgi:hypothetical protein